MCVSIFPSPDACAKVWPAAPNTRAVMAMLIRIGFNSSLTALPQLLYEFRILMITGNHMQFHLCLGIGVVRINLSVCAVYAAVGGSRVGILRNRIRGILCCLPLVDGYGTIKH